MGLVNPSGVWLGWVWLTLRKSPVNRQLLTPPTPLANINTLAWNNLRLWTQLISVPPTNKQTFSTSSWRIQGASICPSRNFYFNLEVGVATGKLRMQYGSSTHQTVVIYSLLALLFDEQTLYERSLQQNLFTCFTSSFLICTQRAFVWSRATINTRFTPLNLMSRLCSIKTLFTLSPVKRLLFMTACEDLR